MPVEGTFPSNTTPIALPASSGAGIIPTSQGGESGGSGGAGGGDWIGALIGLGTMLWNNYQQRKMMEQQNAYNRQNAQEAYDRDVAFWEKQNAYNSPVAQMARWKEAGLNPNLIYGGSSSGGNATSMPRAPIVEQGALPRLMMGNIPELISQFQDVQMKHAQIDNVKAQTDNIQSRTFNESLRSNLLEIQPGMVLNKNRREESRLNFEKAKWIQDYEQKELMNPMLYRKALFDLESRQEMFPYQLEGTRQSAFASRYKTQQEISKLGLMSQQSLMNMLRMDAMKRNLTTMGLNQERMVADTILKQYQAQQIGGPRSAKEKNDEGVLTALIRGITMMF